MTQKPTIGDTVQYGIGRYGDGKTVWRPAIVVEDWGGNCDPRFSGPNLQVWLDGTNDCAWGPNITDEECARGLAWRTSVVEGGDIGQWRWPPMAAK